jgi:hypothetical protein
MIGYSRNYRANFKSSRRRKIALLASFAAGGGSPNLLKYVFAAAGARDAKNINFPKVRSSAIGSLLQIVVNSKF